jgi:hypothetical protein
MSTTDSTANVTLIAGEDLALGQFAKISTTDGQVVAADDAAAVDYIVAETVLSGQSVPLIKPDGSTAGIQLAGTLSAGDAVMPDANGHAIAEATAGSLGCGILIDGGVDNDIVRLQFRITRRHAA